MQLIRLLRLDVGRTDYLSPLIDFFGDEFAEFRRRVRKNKTARLSKASFEIWIRESRTNLLIEPFNDLSRRVFGCTNTIQPLPRNPAQNRPSPVPVGAPTSALWWLPPVAAAYRL